VRQSGKTDELYNLQSDISEQRNLQTSLPADAARLATVLDAWDKELVPPAFPGAGGRKPQKGKSKAK
jgi:hypothetical protein